MMRQDRRSLLDNLFIHSSKMRLEDVFEKLLVLQVINETVMESIKDEYHSERDRRREMIRAIQRRGDYAYDAFYQALFLSGHEDLAAILQPLANVSAMSSPQPMQSPISAERSRMSMSNTPKNLTQHFGQNVPPMATRCDTPGMATNCITNMRGYAVNSPASGYRERSSSRTRSAFANLSGLNINYQQNMYSDTHQRHQSPSNARTLMATHRSSHHSPSPYDEYHFDEESMNYTDAPFVQRVFDKETMYPNFTNPRGLCLVINNEHFDTMPPRSGTKQDKENISNLFRCMGYKVVCKDNLTAREITHAVHEFTREPIHRISHSAIIVIMSHGEDNVIYGCDDAIVATHDLYDLLSASKAPFLADKPKLVFVQACRGDRRDNGFPIMDEPDGVPAMMRRMRDKGDGPLFNFLGCVRPQVQPTWRKKPDHADILIAYATTSKFVSWRNSVKGSWFIQAICEVFSKHSATMEIVEMLTEVNKKVALGFQTSQGPNTLKQMPELTSRLVKKFYFWPIRSSSV